MTKVYICPKCGSDKLSSTHPIEEGLTDQVVCTACNYEAPLAAFEHDPANLLPGVEGQCCGNCKFWFGLGNGHGECRPRAPRSTYDPDGKTWDSDFALTSENEWCGDWAVRIRKPAGDIDRLKSPWKPMKDAPHDRPILCLCDFGSGTLEQIVLTWEDSVDLPLVDLPWKDWIGRSIHKDVPICWCELPDPVPAELGETSVKAKRAAA